MGQSFRYEARGQFGAPPEVLWPLLADTPTLNRAIGMPPIAYTITPVEGGGSRIEAAIKLWHWTVARWTEHPFLWREPYGYMVFREFIGGPFVRLRFGVEMDRAGDRTNVLVYAEFEPRNILGRAALWAGIGKRATDKILAQCTTFERYVAGQEADAFPQLRPRQRVPERARVLADALIAEGQPRALASTSTST